jgi:hypothetical protein
MTGHPGHVLSRLSEAPSRLTPAAAGPVGPTALRPLNFPRCGSHRVAGRVSRSPIALGWERDRGVMG